jgi:sugar O-acyltransferase (sialic acid O-acetyltransferase NeuD family)
MSASPLAREVVFWGATGHAKVLRELLRGNDGPRLVALFDNNRDIASPFEGVPLFHGREGFEAWLARQGRHDFACLAAIGGARGVERVELQRFLSGHGLTPLVAQHRTSFVADDAIVGAGSQILAHAVVATGARIGEACIVNTGATIDHECVLGDGVHVCPGAHLAGCVRVGQHVMIGTGAIILPRVQVGDDATIGAGAVVTRDVPPGITVVGNPARPITRTR